MSSNEIRALLVTFNVIFIVVAAAAAAAAVVVVVVVAIVVVMKFTVHNAYVHFIYFIGFAFFEIICLFILYYVKCNVL
jgi:hypothetical protein